MSFFISHPLRRDESRSINIVMSINFSASRCYVRHFPKFDINFASYLSMDEDTNPIWDRNKISSSDLMEFFELTR